MYEKKNGILKPPPSLERYMFKEKAGSRTEDIIRSFDLELSRRCNQRCIYCFADAGEAPEGELTLDELKKVVLQAKGAGAHQAVIVGGGEPLLYEGLKELIEFIKNEQLAITLLTNGVLLDDSWLDYFLGLDINLCVKLNAFKDTGIHDYLTSNSGSCKIVKAAVERALKKGYTKTGKPYLILESIICGLNYAEIPYLWRWARDNEILPFMEVVTPQGRARNNKELSLSKDKIKDMFFKLKRIDEELYGYTWIPYPPIAAFPCRRNDYSCYVTSTGEVYPCAGLNLSVGNIRNRPLKSILKSSPLIKKMRNIKTYLEGKCSTCEHNNVCYGCRGKAFSETGNPFAQDPVCWR
ncbi:MAG: radical SAM protein [Candidatus Omnitrophica bacterium]|nr:radical SAM protein [Candidatus Omnitrophota bacterium]MBD3269092.1 radical SAM protein [Candidatus Omnitrophota bacterium]